MQVDKSIYIKTLLVRLWRQISLRRRKQLLLLLMLIVIVSLFEVLTIGAIVPFLGALTSPEFVASIPLLRDVIRLFDLNSPQQLLLFFTSLFGFFAIMAGGMRLLMLWASTRLAASIGYDLSVSIYSKTLYQPYSTHVARNSSELITGVITKINEVVYGVISPMLTLFSSALMLAAILFALVAINSNIALLAFGGFGFIYLAVVQITRGRLAFNSQRIADESVQVVKALQEGLGGIRDVLLDGTQEVYCSVYKEADLTFRQAQAENQFLGGAPRYCIESLGMLTISILAYEMAQQPTGISAAIPLLGSLALGAQRMLPVLQQAYGSWSSVRSTQSSLLGVLELLEQPVPGYAINKSSVKLNFEHEICFHNVCHKYSKESSNVLSGVDLVISKGERVGFIGVTGSGKSTLLDLVMGLLTPTGGAISVDGVMLNESNLRGWQSRIAHVPQTIYLADVTIAENIAFGVPAELIDVERVCRAASQAQIHNFIEGLPAGYMTNVGERGVLLSGGQRQRIGIARALYKQADVIVFDEATSALDNETEAVVMRAIDALSAELTVLLIAHRLTTLSGCTKIVELSEGVVKRVGSYSEIVAVGIVAPKAV